MGWPQSWLECDVLFLIPSVWLGPWICPALISLLFIVWGFWTLRSVETIAFAPPSFMVFVVGAMLGIAAFLQPAVAALNHGGMEELSRYTPGNFWWWLFVLSYLMMACGLGLTVRGVPVPFPATSAVPVQPRCD